MQFFVCFFKIGIREFGIGLRSGTRETPDVVVIEGWINGWPLHRPHRAVYYGCPVNQSRGNSKSYLQNLGPMLNYMSSDE